MKVCICTYCAVTSYGSMLQCYALNSTIKSLGLEPYTAILDWEVQYPTFAWKWIRKLLQHNMYVKRNSAYDKGKEFIIENISFEFIHSLDDDSYPNLKADIYLAGSDQIWHPNLCRKLFFLDFVHDNKPKISYAASMGNTEIPSPKRQLLQQLLNNIDIISVREFKAKEILQQFTTKRLEVHVDPTFLLNMDQWRSLEKPCSASEEYILVYPIYWNKSYDDELKILKKKTGLKIIALNCKKNICYADEYYLDCGPREFLWLIDHARYIVTSSFHGVAFSIIFQKKFATIIDPANPDRIKNILHILSVPQVSILALTDCSDFDYCAIEAHILKEKEKSITYLKEGLLNEYIK